MSRSGRPSRLDGAALEARQAEVAELYLQGRTQFQIAQQIGVSQQTISRDIKMIRRRWAKESVRYHQQMVQEEFHRLRMLERSYWEAWEASKGLIETKRTSRRGAVAGIAGDDDGGENPGVIDASVETTTSFGDPRYLQGIERCIEQRRRIAALDAADRAELKQVRAELKRIAQIIQESQGGAG